MKRYLLLPLICLLAGPLFAQKIIEKKLPYVTGREVNMNLKFGDSIRVRYWDKPEVSVRMAVEVNGGRLNDAFLVETAMNEREISVKTDFDREKIKEGRAEDCPGNASTWRTDRDGQNHYICSRINYDVYVPKEAGLKIETINGNIEIQGSAGAPVHAKTISGFVDMGWPGNRGANVAMKTITGEAYTDLAISFPKEPKKNPIVGYQLEGTINGGGPEVRLESISNNVYLRKTR
ncbi:hypothetical protein [Larkinella soli]|uniref:hypothetical protein n=1 Tax=Larkinella soli TaxID=1770527 RepID=UPI000FFBD37E|nr:hypothetical protein [Larkinella soli]